LIASWSVRRNHATPTAISGKSLTIELLLPLPVAKARTISLENHLALVTMRHGHRNADVANWQVKTVCGVLSLRSAAWRSVLEPFRKAERALLRSVKRVKLKEGWSMFNEDGDPGNNSRIQ
jgi:hypothetical protein